MYASALASRTDRLVGRELMGKILADESQSRPVIFIRRCVFAPSEAGLSFSLLSMVVARNNVYYNDSITAHLSSWRLGL